MLGSFLRTHVTVGQAVAAGTVGALAVAGMAYHAGSVDSSVDIRHLVADYAAKDAVIGSYSEELAAKHLELSAAHEVLTQAVRVYEDGSVVATAYAWDGTDLVPTEHVFCQAGELCDE